MTSSRHGSSTGLAEGGCPGGHGEAVEAALRGMCVRCESPQAAMQGGAAMDGRGAERQRGYFCTRTERIEPLSSSRTDPSSTPAGGPLRALGRPAQHSCGGSIRRSKLHAAQSPAVCATAASPVDFASASALRCGASACLSPGDKRAASVSRRLASLPGARWSLPFMTAGQSDGKAYT